MITPEEIKRKALKWWRPILQSETTGNSFFPKTIDRIGKVQPGNITHQFSSLQQDIERLYRHSKNQTGAGYMVKTSQRTFKRTGIHELPDSIVFETIDDYIIFTGKKKEWNLFSVNYKQILKEMPELKNWVFQHCLWLTDNNKDWVNILKVCRYFVLTPRPQLYLRQLPIEVHTKFIEENVVIMTSLLDFLIPEHIRNPNESRFAERYYLKYDEPLIRVRFLDSNEYFYNQFSDISIPLSDFEKFSCQSKNVLITENKMNFLALPAIPSTIAVWSGGGFNISFLKETKWLNNKEIYYWGDIDEHGFQILHQLRTYYPQVKSILMDKITFNLFRTFAVNGPRNNVEFLNMLTYDENALFQHLKSLHEKNRLEQEKLLQLYVDNVLKKVLHNT